jgi:hypothetical protein
LIARENVFLDKNVFLFYLCSKLISSQQKDIFMHRPIPSTQHTEELSPGLYRQMGLRAPFVWLAVMVMRLGLRAGIFSPDFLIPSRPNITPDLFHRNRHLRRARESCLRRVRRHVLKGCKINPENYTPRDYAHFAYVNMMDKTVTPGRFMENYIRDNDLSRVQVYGMDAAHRISGFVKTISETLLSMFSWLPRVSALNFAAPTDPAPP